MPSPRCLSAGSGGLGACHPSPKAVSERELERVPLGSLRCPMKTQGWGGSPLQLLGLSSTPGQEGGRRGSTGFSKSEGDDSSETTEGKASSSSRTTTSSIRRRSGLSRGVKRGQRRGGRDGSARVCRVSGPPLQPEGAGRCPQPQVNLLATKLQVSEGVSGSPPAAFSSHLSAHSL